MPLLYPACMLVKPQVYAFGIWYAYQKCMAHARLCREAHAGERNL